MNRLGASIAPETVAHGPGAQASDKIPPLFQGSTFNVQWSISAPNKLQLEGLVTQSKLTPSLPVQRPLALAARPYRWPRLDLCFRIPFYLDTPFNVPRSRVPLLPFAPSFGSMSTRRSSSRSQTSTFVIMALTVVWGFSLSLSVSSSSPTTRFVNKKPWQ